MVYNLLRLKKEGFLHLASLIQECFPTETSGTYYVSPSKGRNPTGKLLSSYANLRHSLAEVGIISRTNRRSLCPQSPSFEAVEMEFQETDAQQIIESEVINEEDLEEAWKLTFEHRQKILKTSISTVTYIEKYQKNILVF